jgi:hypothetical protein
VLREFLIASAARFGDAAQIADVESKSDDEMEELLHRMIVSRPDLRELHRDSREWLFRHGVDPVADGGQRN